MKFDFYHPDVDMFYSLKPKQCFGESEIQFLPSLVELGVAGNPDSLVRGFGPNGIVWGLCGSYRLWNGNAQLWAVWNENVDSYPISLTKACLTLVNFAVQKQDLKRVSLTVRCGYNEGNRFAETLGFTLEGTMRHYLPDGADVNLYARLF